jgi:hypothetical protein
MKITIGSRGRHYAVKFSIFLILAALITGMPASYGVGGDDNHPSENLEIRTWYDLDDVRDNLAGNHTLMNNLNSTTPGYTELASPTANGGNGWEPIGYSISETSCQRSTTVMYGLSGTFDGQGHEIRDLFINRPDESAGGLLGYLNEGGIIKNVCVVNVTVIGYNGVGSLVGYESGIIKNVCVVNVTVNGNNAVGSLVGYEGGGTISNCYSTGNVTGHASIGGLVGSIYEGRIINSYSTGSVTGQYTGIGGLVGNMHSEGTISNSYSTCSVAGVGVESKGGLVGDNYYGDVNVISSFWNTETSGLSTSDGGTGKNTTEMQDITTFSVAGWNITAVAPGSTNTTYIWNIVNNVTYPFLSWQPVS